MTEPILIQVAEVKNNRPGRWSQGGNNQLAVQVSPIDLKTLRLELNQSIRVFGLTLKKAINPKAVLGFSHVYVLALETGKRKITPELERAFWRIAAAHDGVDPDTSSALSVSVFAVHDISGALVTGKVKSCARPGCPVRFVHHHPRQKYHSAFCRKQAKGGR